MDPTIDQEEVFNMLPLTPEQKQILLKELIAEAAMHKAKQHQEQHSDNHEPSD